MLHESCGMLLYKGKRTDCMYGLRRKISLIYSIRPELTRVRMAFFSIVIAAMTLQSAYSQISIPGVSSRFETNQMIEDIIDAESAPIRRNEQRIEDLEKERDAWNRLSRDMSALQDAANTLYSFRNPFLQRIASSTDSSVLTASAVREAPESVSSLEVLQTASADVFRSASLPEDFRVPGGRYTFGIGDSEISVPFEGGSITEFVASVNRRASQIVEVRSVRDTRSSRILIFEGQITGAANRLNFADDAETLALETNTIRPRATEADRDIRLARETVTLEDGETGSAGLSDGTVVLEPTSSAFIDTEPRVVLEEGLVLSFEISVENLGREEFREPVEPRGPTVPELGETELDGVRVPFASSVFDLPEWIRPEPPAVIDDLNILTLLDGSQDFALPPLEDTDGFMTISFPVGEALAGLTGIEVSNRSTFRRVHLQNIRVYDPDSVGDFEPVLALETARDARLRIDGIEVNRDTNDIDDLIEGVTLSLQDTGIARLRVEPDAEAIKNAIIEFLALYNQIMVETNILTRTSREIVSQISWFTDEEAAEAEERLGLMQGDSTLNQLRSRLQTIMMNPYETRLGSELRILQQIGVSSNASGPGAGVDTRQLRGYLEMNEDVLDAAIAQNHRAIRDLFGFDTDRDGIIDAGAAFEVHNYVRGFTQTGGIITTRTQSIDRRISDANTQIGRDSERLERREAQLRREFAQMESAVDSMEDMRRRLEGLNTNQNR